MGSFLSRSLLAHFLVSLSPFICFQTLAFACLCTPPEDVAERVRASNLIFEGTVEHTGELRSWFSDDIEYEAVLLVEKYWKGGSGDKKIKVRTRSPFGACGFFFEKGKRYLVYARDGWFSVTTDNCGGTAELQQAGKDVDKFAEIFKK